MSLRLTGKSNPEMIHGCPSVQTPIAVSAIICHMTIIKNRGYGMKSVSVFSVLRSGLYALTACGLMSSTGAQIPGPGQVGGMGQGGAPAGEFPSDQGNITYGQRYTPAEDFPPEPIRDNKDRNGDKSKKTPSDSSGESLPQPDKRSAGEKMDTSIESEAPESHSPGTADAGAKQK
mgnify:FL=1